MNELKKDPIRFNIFKDKMFLITIIIFSVISMIPLFLILGYILTKGFPVLLSSFQFFTLNAPPNPLANVKFELLQEAARGTAEWQARIEAIGGVGNAIVGTLIIVFLGSIMAIPFGVAVGIYLSENKNSKIAQVVLVAVDMIQGIPSIIFGIVVSLWLVKTVNVKAFAGSVALALMMLPIVIKNTEETLKLIPHSLKEAALALGCPYWKVIFKVLIPTGMSGIMTGILVGVSRIMGETAPLLFTAVGSPFFNVNLSDEMQALPLVIYNGSRNAYQNIQANAWGASAVLVILVLLLNLISKVVVNKWKVKY